MALRGLSLTIKGPSGKTGGFFIFMVYSEHTLVNRLNTRVSSFESTVFGRDT